MKKKTRARWQNLIMYVGASLEAQQAARSLRESKEINDEMYKWLNDNYTLTQKVRKSKLFNV